MPDHPNDDLKAKMKEALANKQGRRQPDPDHHDRHPKEKAHDTHGPQGGVHVHRRKAGGGGA